MRWIDRYSGERYGVTLSDSSPLRGEARLKSYGEVIRAYRFHPEFKSDDPEGGVCRRDSRGLLRRTAIEAAGVVYIGKESNKLEDVEEGTIHDLGEVLNEYHNPRSDPFAMLVLPVLRQMPLGVIVSASGLDASSVKRIRAGKQRPHPQNLARLTEIASAHALAVLATAGQPAPPDGVAAMHRVLS